MFPRPCNGIIKQKNSIHKVLFEKIVNFMAILIPLYIMGDNTLKGGPTWVLS
jgi:hypothetical protein